MTASLTQPRLRVLILSDGIPGHENQALGMAGLLGNAYRVETHVHRTTLRQKWLRPLLRLSCNQTRHCGIIRSIQRCYQSTYAGKKPDLIISAGGNTAFLNISLAQQFNCPNFFLGSLRGLRGALFTALFTLERQSPGPENIVLDIVPTGVSPESTKAAAKSRFGETIPPLWTLLIGGDGAGYHYQNEDWQALAKGMRFCQEKFQIRWLITTSRRTGASNEEHLRQLIAVDEPFEATWYGHLPEAVSQAYMGAAERIFCTEDSMTMLQESIASGQPVTSLRPAEARPTARYDNAIATLEEKGLLNRLDLPGFAEGNCPSPTASLPTDWQTRLLTTIAHRLPPPKGQA